MRDIENINSVSYKRSLIIGTLLGDAHSRRKDNRRKMKAEYRITHGIKQKDLVEWKAKEIQRLYSKEINVYNDLKNVKSSFYIGMHGRLRIIHDWFHRRSLKIITNKIRFMDHPIGLSMILCDDGHIRKRKKSHIDGNLYYLAPSITIATHCFDETSVNILLNHIKSLCDAEGYINPERRWRNGILKEYNRINFNCENSQKIWNYVRRWIPRIPSMLKKFSYAIDSFGID